MTGPGGSRAFLEGLNKQTYHMLTPMQLLIVTDKQVTFTQIPLRLRAIIMEFILLLIKLQQEPYQTQSLAELQSYSWT